MGSSKSKPSREKSDEEEKTETSSLFLSGAKVFQAEDFEIGEYLAEGGSGKVYSCRHKETNKKYALKFFGYCSRRVTMRSIEKEIDIMMNLREVDGLVHMLGVFIDTEDGLLPNKVTKREYPVIVMELLEGGELFDYIDSKENFSEDKIASIFRQIVETLNGMHKRGYLHRDIKLDNLLFLNSDADSPLKVIDFGLVVRLKKKKKVYHGTSVVGTRGYIAPESINMFQYSPASDIWEAGCILYMLLCGRFPFDPNDFDQVTKGIYFPMKGLGWDNITPKAKDLVRSILVLNPRNRPTAEKVLRHPWIVSQAPLDKFGIDHMQRLKNLVLCQKLKKFFNDSDIREESANRNTILQEEIPTLLIKCCELDDKLKNLKKIVIKSFKEKVTHGTHSACVHDLDFEAFCSLMTLAGLKELVNRRVFNIFDTGNTGTVDMKDFLLTMIAFRFNDPEHFDVAQPDQCRLYFRLFDINDTGTIDMEELKLVIRIIFGDQFPETENTEELFNTIDSDHNGQISYSEFRKFYNDVLSNAAQ